MLNEPPRYTIKAEPIPASCIRTFSTRGRVNSGWPPGVSSVVYHPCAAPGTYCRPSTLAAAIELASSLAFTPRFHISSK